MGVRATFGSPAPAIPGQPARCDITVANTGDHADDVRLTLTGEAVAWGWITPATLSLGPGETEDARMTLRLPRAPVPPAGPLAITVRVDTSTGSSEVQGTVDVAAFTDVLAALDPPTSRDGRHALRVENRGNTAVSAGVEATGDDVSVRATPDRLDLPPGGSQTATLKAKAGRAPFRGSTTTRAFEVLVRPDGDGRPARVEGAVELAPAGWVGRVALLLLVLAVAGVAAGALVGGADDEPGDEAPAAAPAAANPDCPAHGHLSPDANGTVRPGVQPSFDYTFLFATAGGCQPVRFNPCQPVRYAVNRGQASDADVADLTQAMAKLSTATGLVFERVADTLEDPRQVPRARRQPDGTLAWPPVVIGWSHLGSGDSLRGRNDTRASPDVVVGGGGRPEIVSDVIVTGNLVLNLDAVTDTDTRGPVPHGFGTGVNWGRIMLHELAHVIGLGHVESRTSIMTKL